MEYAEIQNIENVICNDVELNYSLVERCSCIYLNNKALLVLILAEPIYSNKEKKNFTSLIEEYISDKYNINSVKVRYDLDLYCKSLRANTLDKKSEIISLVF